MSVDVEEHFHVSAFAGCVPRDSWDGQTSRVVANTRRMLDLFEEAGVRSTCFVLGWVAERNPELVREIARRGHEVGSHGWGHELVYDQTEDRFRGELERSRKLLQDLSGQPVDGHRAASFSIDDRNPWGLDVVAEVGFRYDSSVFPVRHDRYGVPDAPRHIHEMTTSRGHRLIEFPPTTWRVLGHNVALGGGGYLRIYPLAFTRLGFRRVHAASMPAMVYVHPWEVDPQQPRIDAPWLSRLRHYRNLHTTESKLRALMQRFAFAPLAEVIERWSAAGARGAA